MTRVRPLLPALLLGLLLAACGRDGGVLPPPTIDGATIDGDTLVLEGENFAQRPGGARVTVEACGVTVDAEIVDPTTAVVTLAPGQRVTLELGDRLEVDATAIVAGEGSGDVRIVTGDGREAVLVDAVVCEGGVTNGAPVAVIGAEAPDGHVLASGDVEGPDGFTVAFSASGSGDPDGDALSYAWSFGEGDVADGAEVERTFAEPGSYPVSLTVADPSGATDEATITVTVHAAPVADVAISTLFDVGDGFPMRPRQVEEPVDPEMPAWHLALDASSSTGHDLTYAWFWPQGTGEDEPAPPGMETEWPEEPGATGPLVEESFAMDVFTLAHPFAFRLQVRDAFDRTDVIEVRGFLDPAESAFDDVFRVQQLPEAVVDGLRLSWFERPSTGHLIVEIETLDDYGPRVDLCAEAAEVGTGALVLFGSLETEDELPPLMVPFVHWHDGSRVPVLGMEEETSECPQMDEVAHTAPISVAGSVARVVVETASTIGRGTDLAMAMIFLGTAIEGQGSDAIPDAFDFGGTPE